MSLAEPDAAAMVPLPPVLDVGAAEDLRRRLRESLAGNDGGVVVRGRGVERVSTACLQVLAAAARTARARGLAFTLEGASPVLETALDDLGLSAVLAGEDPA